MVDAIRAWWLTGLAALSAGFLLFVGVALISGPDSGQGVSDRAFGAGFFMAGVLLIVGLARLRAHPDPIWIANTLIVVGALAVGMFWWLLVPAIVAVVLIYSGVVRKGLQRELLAVPASAGGGAQ